jgi:transposase-like protein
MKAGGKKAGKGTGGRKGATKRKAAVAPSEDFRAVSGFQWDAKTSAAAVGLAEGKTQQEVANEIGVTDRTIRNWLAETEFAVEVDRLSLMVGIASRAERLRLAQRVVRQKSEGGLIVTDKDLLDWVKFAQSETDGAKLDLTALAAAFGQAETPVADGGQAGSGKTQV